MRTVRAGTGRGEAREAAVGVVEDRGAVPHLTRPPSRRLMVAYRVMAFTTAVLLIVLVFVGIPLQTVAGRPQVVNVVGTMHGFLYLVYLVVAFVLTLRLRVPKGRMLLVLLAGTVPFCAFVAERKMTRRFEAATSATSSASGAQARRGRGPERAAELRRRWLSRRAFLLHAEVLVVAPACLLAGWWQATQALGGNELSWVYSVEWPIFAVLAVWGWWHLVHEDPEAFRARRWRTAGREGAEPASLAEPSAAVATAANAAVTTGTVTTARGTEPIARVDAETARWAAVLALAVWLELALGWLTLALVPFGRPSGWLPSRGVAAYGVHASAGVVLLLGAAAFVVWARNVGRTARIVAWTGAVSVGVAGAGGLMTAAASLDRVFGIFLMFAGAALAGTAYLVPFGLRRRAGIGEPAATAKRAGETVDAGAGSS